MSPLHKITGVAHGVSVLLRAGMLQPTRPLTTARGSRAMRKLGPIAGAANMSALRAPDDVAVIDERGSLTYGELDGQCNALARAWSELGIGIGDGDVVGVLCRDHRGVVQAMVAAGKLGARLVLLNTGFAKPQLADVAAREQVKIVVFDEEFTDLLNAVAPEVVRVLAWTDSDDRQLPTLDEMIDGHEQSKLELPTTQGGLVLLTGGTTGTPKGAPRKVGSPLAAAQFLERVPQRRGDMVYIAAPMFHGTGLSQFIMAFALGSTVVVRRRFDARATLDGVAEHKATVLILVPTMLQRMLAVEQEVDTSSLRIIMSAGAALPTDLGNRAVERFGPVIHNLYGCTEVALATVAMPEDWIAAPGTVGRPPRGIKVTLFDAADVEITKPGVSGRIFVDNGLNFEGYSGGGGKPMIGTMMGTGDTGHWDDGGRLFVDGRDDDMIVSGGENVFPGEIEDLVASMPGVADTASIPVDDEDFGVRLRLFVVPDGSAALTEDDIKDHVKANLARFKVPREVVLLDAIPYTAAGKVARRELGRDRGLTKQSVQGHQAHGRLGGSTSQGGPVGLSKYRMTAMIAVTDMTRATEFYEGKLGLAAVRTDADGSKVYTSAGEDSLVVYPSPDHAGTSTATLVAWHVDDVEQTVDELTSKGVSFEQYEGVLESGFDYSTDEKGISPRAGGGKVAWFKDPDENLFSIEGDR